MRKTEEFSYFLSSLAEWKMRKGSEILTYRAAVPICQPDDNYIFLMLVQYIKIYHTFKC